VTARVIAVHHDPWPPTAGDPDSSRAPWALYRRAVRYKANPRPPDYLRALLAERFPEAEWLATAADPSWPERIAGADVVVLLYPDATGLGFLGIERALRSRLRPGVEVIVLNGRRRQFRWDRAARWRLRLRRALEWTMLVEFLAVPVFIAATPLLWALDAMRGRR